MGENIPQTKYDVFISFRGDDILRGFLSHLIESFKSKHINSFVDDKLERGEEIWKSLVEAIKGSSISLIIFSQDYASSPWCLDELVTILECREKYERIVIPVFYYVEPTNVRRQSGSYRYAFVEHRGKYETKVQLWKHALKKSADLSGIESAKFRDDAELVKEIVNLVLKRLSKPSVNSNGHVGIQEKVASVASWIKEYSKRTLVIGICGMEGIGKTTLAKEVFNKLHSEYEGSVFLADERDQSNKYGIHYLKEKMVSGLLGYDVKIDIADSLPRDIISRISCMKNLIVFDDVNNPEHLKILLQNHCNFGWTGSTIIVTTRDEQVLQANRVHKTYKLKGLSSDKAIELFNMNVFGQSDNQREYKELSERVVNYAQGIPLVVKVLAGLLHGKNKEEWESTLDKLKKMPPTNVYDVMKLCYDGLDSKGKQIFLDLACFLLRMHKPVNVGYLNSLLKDNESDDSVAFELGRLKDKALIFSEDSFVSMHASLQEMAWEIVRRIDSKSRSRLWDPDAIYEVLKNDKGIDSIRSIQLHSTINQKLSPHIFAKMRSLIFLEIGKPYYDLDDELDILCTNACLPKWHWQYWPKQQKTQFVDILAKGLKFFVNELRFLSWVNYPLKSLPENFSGEKLVILKLAGDNLKKLWDGVKNLVNLKEVDLTCSYMLTELPDLSKATNLEVLVLKGCLMLTSVHPSIFSLAKLEKLDLSYCESLTTLASDSNLCNLSYLNLYFCKNLREFSVVSKNMKELNLEYTKVKELPSSFGCQSKLKLLHLEGSAIERLPSSFDNLTKLLHLDLSHCCELQTIEALPPCLQTLNARGCHSLQTIPKLPQSLQTLNAQACFALQSLPELPSSLENFSVEFCTSLENPPEIP